MMKPAFKFVATALAALPLLMMACSKDEPSGPEYVDEGVEINGIVWATRNVAAPGTFAETPEEFGMYYQWNRRTGWADPVGSKWDGAPYTDPQWQSGNDPCPAGWRLPTRDENRSLDQVIKVDWSYTTQNGVAGSKFVDKENGNSLFLPSAGYIGADGVAAEQGTHGYYRSVTPYPETGNGYVLYFREDRTEGSGDGEGLIFLAYKWPYQNGYSVRCVRK